MLIPNDKQKTKLFECAGVSRWVYNWVLSRQQENYKSNNCFLFDNQLRKELTQLKKTEDYNWLNCYSNDIAKQAVKDACDSYIKFFKGYSKFPNFKSKKKSKPSFYQDSYKIKFTSTHVKLEKLTENRKKNKRQFNWVRLSEHNRIPFGEGVKYINPRVTFDGLNWWISIGIECVKNIETSNNTEIGIGIDLGVKDLAICSNEKVYGNINKTPKIKKIEKKRRRLQRQISRKYTINKEGGRYKKTRNIIKNEKQLLKLNRTLKNIRNQYQYDVINDIINRKPMFITIEDLNISGMLKNKHLSKAIQQQSLHEFTRKLNYKCSWSGVELRQVDRFFPSSKLCSECGAKNKLLKLSDRNWTCQECGTVHDRDFNASKNLRDCTEYKLIA